MATNAKQERCDARDAVLLTDHQEKGQHILQYLIGIAQAVPPASFAYEIISDDVTWRYCLSRKELAQCVSRHDIPSPVKCKDLTVSVFQEPDSSNYTPQDLDGLSLLLALPKERASTRHRASDS